MRIVLHLLHLFVIKEWEEQTLHDYCAAANNPMGKVVTRYNNLIHDNIKVCEKDLIEQLVYDPDQVMVVANICFLLELVISNIDVDR